MALGNMLTISGYCAVPDSGELEVAEDISSPGVDILFTDRGVSVLQNATEAVASVSDAGIAVVSGFGNLSDGDALSPTTPLDSFAMSVKNAINVTAAQSENVAFACQGAMLAADLRQQSASVTE